MNPARNSDSSQGKSNEIHSNGANNQSNADVIKCFNEIKNQNNLNPSQSDKSLSQNVLLAPLLICIVIIMALCCFLVYKLKKGRKQPGPSGNENLNL